MIGSLPISNLAPIEYRYALDAAMPILSGKSSILVVCDASELGPEVYQRISVFTTGGLAQAALWVEPKISDWQGKLQDITLKLAPGSILIIVASRPMARLLPERHSWSKDSLGLKGTGIQQLQRALTMAGYKIEANHGIHTATSMVLNAFSQIPANLGRFDLVDRIHFAGRLNYRTEGAFAIFSTVGLFFARKVKN